MYHYIYIYNGLNGANGYELMLFTWNPSIPFCLAQRLEDFLNRVSFCIVTAWCLHSISFARDTMYLHGCLKVSSQCVTHHPYIVRACAIMDKLVAQVIELHAHLKVAQKQVEEIEKELWSLMENQRPTEPSSSKGSKRSLSGERDMKQFHARRRVKKESEETLALGEAFDPAEDVTQTLKCQEG